MRELDFAPSRRAFLRGSAALVGVGALAACAGQTPAQVSDDIGLIAAGLQAQLGNMPNTPAAANTALADLVKGAADFSTAESTSAQKPIAQRVIADVLAIAPLVLPLVPVGGPAAMAIEAAEVLLPVIAARFSLPMPAGAPRLAVQMSPDTARLVLLGAARP